MKYKVELEADGRKRSRMNNGRLAMCGHEIGHMSMIFWRNESLDGYKAIINADGSGALFRTCGTYNVTELMVKIAGPLVEWLMHGSTPERAIRFGSEYKDPRSDSSHIREMVRHFCDGVDSRKFQFEVQERTRSIIQQPAMWRAINEAAEKLYQAGSITGEEAEAIFDGHGVQTMFDSPMMVEWVVNIGTWLRPTSSTPPLSLTKRGSTVGGGSVAG